MKRLILLVILFTPYLVLGQTKEKGIQSELIESFKVNDVDKKYITNLLGSPKDTLKGTLYFEIPTYPELGVSFHSAYTNIYTSIIIEINKVKNGFNSAYLNFKPNMSLLEFTEVNLEPTDILFIKKNLQQRQFNNRIIILYSGLGFEIISEPLTMEQLQKSQDVLKLNEDGLTSKDEKRILKEIKCEYIWGNFFEGPPKAN